MVKRLLTVLAVCNLFFAATLPLFADVSTTATVPPHADNFQFSFTSNDSGSTFAKQQTLTYTITYGASSSASFSTATTLTADFSNDTIQGTHVLDYVFGSASHTYQDIPAVVDTEARKITWTIPSLPPGVTDQKVTFQLKTNSDYSGTSPVNFSVKAIMSNQYVTLPEQNIYQTLDPKYQPPQQQQSITTTPTPTPLPSPAPQITPTVAVNDVFFNTIEDTKAEVSVHTTLPVKITLFYGTTYASFSQAVATGDYAAFTKTLLDNLKPNTAYYARITAVDKNGNRATSDIFTFKTAATSPEVAVDKSTAVLTSDGNVLTTITQGITQHAGLQTILPNSAKYEVTYALPPSTKVKYIDVLVRNKHVLALNNYAYAAESNITLVPMLEKEPGLYYAQLPPILLSGEYELYVRVAETNGTIREQKVGEIRVSLPLKILEKITNDIIADARAYFYIFNAQTKKFEPLTQFYSNLKNPEFSDKNGFVNTVLPNGLYKVTVSSIFHGNITKEFTLQRGSDYPTIYLSKQSTDIASVLEYIGNGIFDFGNSLNSYVLSVAGTAKYFNIIALLIVGIFVILTFILSRIKFHIPFKQMPVMLYHHLHHTLLPFSDAILLGRVFAPSGLALPGVEVYALDDDEKVLFHTTTNRQGGFTYKRQKHATHFHFLQEGYEQLNMPIAQELSTKIVLTQNPDTLEATRDAIIQSLEKIGGLFFEGILILSLLLECIFLNSFGFLQTLPFLLCSLANILLWVFYLKDGFRKN